MLSVLFTAAVRCWDIAEMATVVAAVVVVVVVVLAILVDGTVGILVVFSQDNN
jgi:hypothetical protein